jgi:hypothetical protein
MNSNYAGKAIAEAHDWQLALVLACKDLSVILFTELYDLKVGFPWSAELTIFRSCTVGGIPSNVRFWTASGSPSNVRSWYSQW